MIRAGGRKLLYNSRFSVVPPAARARLAAMPIYAYRCSSCGHEKDVIQKFSDAPLTVCPSCGADAFRKQLTAPAFQLKGSGWYVTDFRDGNKGKAAKPAGEGGDAKAGDAPDGAKSDAAKADTAAGDTGKSDGAKPAPAKDTASTKATDGGTSATKSTPST